MSTFNLLEMAKSYFNNDLVNQASSSLGESESGIQKALSAIVPSVIGGMADKASTNDGAFALSQMASDQNESGILDSIGSFLHHDSNSSLLSKSSGMISSLFGGGQSNMLTSLISNFAGVKSSSVGSLLSMAVPTVLGLVGRHVKENNISASGLGTLLGSQKSAAMAALPAGFNLSSITGNVTSNVGSTVHTATNTYNDVEENTGGGMRWLLPLILLAGLAVAAWYFFKDGCNKSDATHVSTNDTTSANTNTTTTMEMPKVTVDSVTGFVNYELGNLGDLTLPNGTVLKEVTANGFENNLVNFLKSGTIDTVNKKANWFTIHDVQFVSGKTEYSSPKATAQISNVAEILKAFPNAVLKIGGYTDITGDAAKNKMLSQSRAEKLMKDIIAGGAAATQLKEAVGYGSEFAEAKAGDKEGMARDRRTAAKVSAM